MYKRLSVVPIVAYLIIIIGLVFIAKPIHASEALSFDEYTAQSKALPYDEFVNGGDAQLYRNDEHHFRINFPAGWEVVDGDGEHVVKKAVKDGCTVLVLVKDFEEFLSEEEKKTLSSEDRDDIRRAELNDFSDGDTKYFLDGVASSEMEYFPGSTVLEKGIRYIDNRKAAYVRMNQVYKVQDRQIEGVSINYFTLHGGKFYQVGGFYPKDDADQESIINTSLATFVFEDWDNRSQGIDTAITSEESTSPVMAALKHLFGKNLNGFGLFLAITISILFTWGLGLLVPLLLRFVFLKRPLSKWVSITIVGFILIIQFLIATALSGKPNHPALFFVTMVSYWVLTKKISEKEKTSKDTERDSLYRGVAQERLVPANLSIASQTEGLNGKWWYRLMKVIYGIAFLVGVAMVVVYINDQYKPRERLDVSRSLIECSNNKIYTSTDLGVSDRGSEISREWDWIVITQDQRKLKRLCITGSLDGSVPLSFDQFKEFNSPQEQIYKVVEKQKTIGSWTMVTSLSLVAILTIALVFWAVGKVFHYVYSGRNPRIG